MPEEAHVAEDDRESAEARAAAGARLHALLELLGHDLRQVVAVRVGALPGVRLLCTPLDWGADEASIDERTDEADVVL